VEGISAGLSGMSAGNCRNLVLFTLLYLGGLIWINRGTFFDASGTLRPMRCVLLVFLQLAIYGLAIGLVHGGLLSMPVLGWQWGTRFFILAFITHIIYVLLVVYIMKWPTQDEGKDE
jgi:hypothetical protein